MRIAYVEQSVEEHMQARRVSREGIGKQMERGLQKVAVVQLMQAQRQRAWFVDLAELPSPRLVKGTPHFEVRR